MLCIVTFARSWQALVATRELGKAGIKVITADTNSYATSFYSKFSKEHFTYPNPMNKEKAFIREIIKRCKLCKKKYKETPTLIPIHKETFTISKYKEKLKKYANLCIENYPKLMNVHDKSNILRLLDNHKIPHPKTIKIRSKKHLESLDIRFPVFLKVLRSAASIGIVKVNSSKEAVSKFLELKKEFKLAPNDYPIIQEYVKGKDYCVTAILNKGKLRAMMSYQNLKSYPYKSGTGVVRRTVKVPQIEKIAKKFLVKIKWHGVIELDFRMARDKKPYFIEANPRFWGGLHQSTASKINYPLLYYQIAAKGDCPQVTKVEGKILTENTATAILSLLDEIKHNEKKQKEIASLKGYWHKAFKHRKDFNTNMKLFFRQLKHFRKSNYDIKTIRQFIKLHKLSRDDIFSREDPFIFMGIFFPIHILLKHHRINKKLLTGEP